MSYETDQIRNPSARRFHGYDGDTPISPAMAGSGRRARSEWEAGR
jgi:hypothetical protein